ncbi:MAG: molybdopterin converting factor subunit 1 [Proteobacteria bacterium]|nr:MAG: molybdopterin converting factor subunit 1 [Pseudomonadota bacterium]
MTAQVTIRYFASLRETAGVPSESLTTAAGSARELYEELSERYGFKLQEKHLKLSINRSYQPFESVLKDGDEIAFIPPVSGG